MSKYKQNKLLNKKVSRLILDISQLSRALADDPEYDRHWKPRLDRLLGFVSDQFVAESEQINKTF
jgi:hypothetical protein